MRKCACRFHGRKCNSDQWGNDKCWCECGKGHVFEKGYNWNPATCNDENGKHLASIMDDSAIMCDKIIESHHNETNFNEKRGTSKMQNFCFTYIFINYYSIIDSC